MLFAALRRSHTPAGNLARVLAAWLVVILLVQGLAALQTLVRGPAHRHLQLPAAGAAPKAPAWGPLAMANLARDGERAAMQERADDAAQVRSHPASRAGAEGSHDRAHALGQPHHHAAGDLAVPADAEAGLDAAACVLMAALAALAASYGWAPPALRGASATSLPWAFAEREVPPPRRPPRV